ncbi:hypothetical protein FRC02_006662 [Tulasnella sp. 418]|nr:hypothetical protein FRC02_006662 [Tulasnella sp. 418]
MNEPTNIGGSAIIQLTSDNYNTWKERLISVMVLHKAWAIVKGDEPKPPSIPPWLTPEQVADMETLSDYNKTAVATYHDKAVKWLHRESIASALMVQAVRDSQLNSTFVSNTKSATENWKAIETYGATLNAGVTGFYLRHELYNLRYIPGTPMLDHLAKIDAIKKMALNTDNPITDWEAADAMIMTLPKESDQGEMSDVL